MTPPTYREIVITFSGLAALIGRMMEWGGVKITVVVECHESDADRALELMEVATGATFPDPSIKLPPRTAQIMGIDLIMRPKQ